MPPHEFSVLGGLEKPLDTRDVNLGAITPKTYTFPTTFSNTNAWNLAVEYQGQQPACGAHAGAYLQDLNLGNRFTPRFTWANIKSFDGYPISDGTDMRSIFKSVKNTGSLEFNLLGNDTTYSLSAYAHPTITPAMNQNAASHKALGYGFGSDLSMKGLKQYISDRGCVILLVKVGPEMWTAQNGTASWLEKDVLPLRTPKSPIGGHFIVAHSYDEQYIYFINSFGDTWGRKGHGYFSENYLPFVIDAGAEVELAFTKDLYFGMTDSDVLVLQRLLNRNPKTQIAVSGPGSPGLETPYFGALTKAAVIRFQNLYQITPAQGYVGPLTRAVINAVAGL